MNFCARYFNATCAECERGYLRNHLGSCQQVLNGVANCRYYAFPDLFRPNAHELPFTTIALNTANITRFQIEALAQELKKAAIISSLATIVMSVIPKCLAVEFDPPLCSRCVPGYFYDADVQSCVADPLTPLNNCRFFSSATVCEECKPGYRLSASKSCEPLTSFVENCARHSGVSGECEECNNGFYLLAGECMQRYMTIEHCQEYSRTTLDCVRCFPQYFYIPKFLICAPQNMNCEVNAVDDNGGIYCQQCLDGFYPDPPGCKQANRIKFCKVYSGRDVCQECYDNYRLVDNQCHEFPNGNFRSCVRYASNDQKCAQCPRNYFPLQSFVDCQLIRNDHCMQKNKKGQCETCADFYMMDKQGACVEGSVPNCEKYAGVFEGAARCEKCKSAFVLENNYCRPVLDLFARKCQQVEGENCLKCAGHYFPLPLHLALTDVIEQAKRIKLENERLLQTAARPQQSPAVGSTFPSSLAQTPRAPQLAQL